MFPELSVTVQVTVVSPSGKTPGASLVVLATAQLSEVVGVPKATLLAVHKPASTLTFTVAGQLIVGSMLSVTVTVCVQVAVFPELSVTVQVTVVSPNGKVAGASLVVLATAQLSEVVGVPKATLLAVHNPASTLTFTVAGQLIVGSILSVTVTVCVQVAVFPELSVTVQVTVVSPIGKTPGASLVVLATAQLSEVVGVPKATLLAVHKPASTLTLTVAGQLIVGSILSVTVTVCVQVAVFPELSVTVQVTVVSPIGKTPGASLVVLATAQLSEVVGVPKATLLAVHKPASTLTFTVAGQLIVGSMLSVTVTVCVQVAVFPELSVTVQVTVVSPSGKTPGASLVALATAQLSEVVGVPKATLLAVHKPASTLTFTVAGQLIVGSILSVTVTVCVQVAVLPELSVTVQVTVVSPIGKTPGASLVVLATAQLSEVVGVPKATLLAVHKPASTLTFTVAGQLIVGSILSVTVTVCVQVAVFPELSVTVQVTVVSPSGKTPGASLVVLATAQLSEVVGVPKATLLAVHNPASTLTFTVAGQLIVGSILSVTVTV
nr:hypothetical protein [Aquimarina spinulae]